MEKGCVFLNEVVLEVEREKERECWFVYEVLRCEFGLNGEYGRLEGP